MSCIFMFYRIHFGFRGKNMLYSAEIGPCVDEKKSEMSVLTVNPDCNRPFYAHTNQYVSNVCTTA